MEIDYKIENDLDWNNAETINIQPDGWKSIKITFIDSQPLVFWRINDIKTNFRSFSDVVSRKGVHEFFSESLISFKMLIQGTFDEMPEERKKFYKENILELFDE